MFTRRNLVSSLVLAAVVLLAGLTAVAAPSAQAAPAAPAYVTGYHYYEGYSDNPSYGSSAFVRFHATNSVGQVWINGSVACPAYNGAVRTWCGWIGNGSSHAQAGVNYTVSGQSFWFRFDVYAPDWYGQLTCTVRGNAGVRAITYCPGVIR